MHSPVRPDDPKNSYQLIAAAVRKVADKANHAPTTLEEAQTTIAENLFRPGVGAPQITHVSFVEEVSFHDKIVVIPDLDMINQGSSEPYEYSPMYKAQYAKQLLLDFEKTGKGPEEMHQWMTDLKDTASTDDEFHAYRLGEYCINQCM